MNQIKKFYHGLFRVEEWLGRALLFAMIFVVVIQVFFRYIMHRPLIWTEEASRFLFVWLIMLEMGHCVATKGHVKVELFIDLMSEKWKRRFTTVMRGLSLLFFLYLIPYSLQMAIAQHKIRSTALNMPYSYIYGMVTVGSVLVVLHIIELFLFDTFRKKEDSTL
ncbi:MULTISPECIES: TRAP transporter small permease [Anaerotruncus]|jgi:TRAP-type C4-dicarboxylate transport system permease small subunit|uniref:TRAP transporter small permease n=1 Tax=Anaerotruncus TaxID=244127 RepID=UPI00083273DD|nr:MULTISPECIES: TRAP transporter small permease [Anaerotruncus]RGX55940.1 TRAP transporter small permease [Anaerotruncus sp. AF02-27]